MQTQIYLIFNTHFGSLEVVNPEIRGWNYAQRCLTCHRSAHHAAGCTTFPKHRVDSGFPQNILFRFCDKIGFGTKVRRQHLSPSAYQPGSPAFQALCATLPCHSAQQPLQTSTLMTHITGPLILPSPITTMATEESPLRDLSYDYGQQARQSGGSRRTPNSKVHRVSAGLCDEIHVIPCNVFCGELVLNISCIHADTAQPMPHTFAMGHLSYSCYSLLPSPRDIERLQ